METVRIFMVLAAILALAACQTTTTETLIWVRTDGRVGANDPALQAQYQIDSTICIGEVQKSAVGAPLIYYQGLAGAISAAMIQTQQQRAYLDIMKGCMAQRGYVLVPQSQAETISAGFRRG